MCSAIFPTHRLGSSILFGEHRSILTALGRKHTDDRFSLLLSNLDATPNQIDDYNTKLLGLAKCLNNFYWPDLPVGNVAFIISGSWIKGTYVRACSDIDVIFLLPTEVKERFRRRHGNIQSQILQEIRNVLLPAYPRTEIKGDGPTVVIDFSNVKVEIASAFLDLSGSRHLDDSEFRVWACHTKDGGEFKLSAPVAEIFMFLDANKKANGKFRDLVRFVKAWTYFCKVPIKSIVVELIAVNFFSTWHCFEDAVYRPEQMIRDFLTFMLTQSNNSSCLPFTVERIAFNSDWMRYAQFAENVAKRACRYEWSGQDKFAHAEWQKIFGHFLIRKIS